MDIEAALGVGLAIGAVQPANGALSPAMVPAVLAAGESVQVEVHAQAALPGVFDAAKEVAPADFRDVGVARVGCDGPVGIWDADVIESSSLDVLKGLLVDELGVMLFQHLGGASWAKLFTERVFVDDALVGGIGIEHARCDERLDRKPASYIDAPYRHRTVSPRFIQCRHILICLCSIIPVIVETHYR